MPLPYDSSGALLPIPGRRNASAKEKRAYWEQQEALKAGNANQPSEEGQQSYTLPGSFNRDLAASQGIQLHPGQGTVVNPSYPLTPEQQFENERAALDELQDDAAIANPYSDADARTQRASALMTDNTELARKAYGLRPDESAYTIDPTMYDSMGWSPDEQYSYERSVNQGRTDATGLDAQTAALQGYSDIANQGGLTAIDRARMAQSHMGREQELQANRAAIMQNAQEQGRAGGNAQMLAQMQGAQGTANMRAMDDLQTNALGLQRRDSAIGAMGQLGGQVQSAQDSIDRFNAEGNRSRQERNIALKNRGIDTKYQDEQAVNRGNVETRNRAEEMNKSDAYGKRGQYMDQVNAITDIQNANEARAAYEVNREQAIQQKKRESTANTFRGFETLARAPDAVIPG